jgi:hypothetical protein
MFKPQTIHVNISLKQNRPGLKAITTHMGYPAKAISSTNITVARSQTPRSGYFS